MWTVKGAKGTRTAGALVLKACFVPSSAPFGLLRALRGPNARTLTVIRA